MASNTDTSEPDQPSGAAARDDDGVPVGGFVRRLRAVAAIDIVGYSKLMSIDETRTHARVNELFRTVVKPLVDDSMGLQIERAGDGLLVLFESSTDAVRCALQIQHAVEHHQQTIDASERMRLRIGVNVGDIIIDGDEIAGDDVNIAVRLQALAEPGTVCISASVRGQLHDELDGAFEDLGDVALKNIGRPIHVYQVRRGNDALRSRRPILRRLLRQMGKSRPAMAAVGLVVVLLSAVAIDRWRNQGQVEPPPMSVAVLPFNAAAGVPPAEKSDFTERLNRSLALTGWLDVRDPNFVARALQRQVGSALPDALNVRYGLRGQLIPGTDGLAVDVNLIDTRHQGSVWTRQFKVPNSASAPGDLAAQLVIEVRQAVFNAEVKRFVESGREPRTALEHKIKGDLEHQNQHSLERERRARTHYQRAVDMDQTYVQAMISLAYMQLGEAELAPGSDGGNLLRAADELSRKVVMLRADSAPGWQLRAEVLARQWLWDAALAASQRALELDPARTYAHGQRASLMLRLGRVDEALNIIDGSAALARQRYGYLQLQRCRALMAQGAYAAAVTACQQSVSDEDWWLPRAHLAAGFALLGEQDKAAREATRLRELLPGASIGQVLALRESDAPAFRQQLETHLLRGMRLAGLP